MDLDKVTSRIFAETEQVITARDAILYALGVGFGAEPLDPGHLRFVYEKALQVSPTIANVLAHPGMWVRDPTYAIDWPRLLHAEQRMEIHAVLPSEGRVSARHYIIGVRDLGERGLMLHQGKTLSDATTKVKLATLVSSLMLRGDRGCGDWGAAPDELDTLPDASPDATIEVEATEMQPLIYRLSGDWNPLHIDPAVAAAAGFPRPILHGLATKGLAGYALLRLFCDFDAPRLGSMGVRFTRPVLPGDRLRFEFWGAAPGTIRFRATVPARGVIVLDRGTAQIR